MATPLTIARETPAWGDPTVYPDPPSPGRVLRAIADGTAVEMGDPDPDLARRYTGYLETAIAENIAFIANTNQVEYLINEPDRTPTP